MAVKLLEIPDEIIQTAVEYLLQDRRIVARTLDTDAGPQPAVLLAGLDQSEKNLAESLIARQAGRHPCPPIDIEKAIAWVEGKAGIQLAVQQREAIRLACQSYVLGDVVIEAPHALLRELRPRLAEARVEIEAVGEEERAVVMEVISHEPVRDGRLR